MNEKVKEAIEILREADNPDTVKEARNALNGILREERKGSRHNSEVPMYEE